MGRIIDRLLGAVGLKRSLENPAVPMSEAVDLLFEAFGGGNDPSGQRVNSERALRLSAVYRCIAVIAESAGSLPVEVLKVNSSTDVEVDETHPAYALIGTDGTPNDMQDAQIFHEQHFREHVLNGATFTEIRRDPKSGKLVDLWPLAPTRARAFVEERRVMYEIWDERGVNRMLFPREVLHTPLLPAAPGVRGVAPAHYGRTAIGVGLAGEMLNAMFLRDGAVGPIVVEVPGKLDENAFKEVQRQVDEARKKGSGSMIFERGFTHKMVDTAQAQVVESEKFAIAQVARFYGVPLFLLGESDKGAPKSSSEEAVRTFYTYTLRPVTRRRDAQYTRKLFHGDPGRWRVRTDLSSLFTADTRTTWLTYSIARQMGIWTINEIRAKLGDPPVPGGDQRLSPVNLDVVPRALQRALGGTLRQAADVCMRAERRFLLEATEDGTVEDRAAAFYDEQEATLRDGLFRAGETFGKGCLEGFGVEWNLDALRGAVEDVARQHCDRARSAVAKDPAAWIVGATLETDPEGVLARMLGQDHGQTSNGNGSVSAEHAGS